MSKTFVKTNEQGYVTFQHNFPFHEKWGLKKTETELLQEGYLIDYFPDPEIREGQQAKAKYEDGQIVYEYTDIPPADDTKQRIDQLEMSVMELSTLIAGGMV